MELNFIFLQLYLGLYDEATVYDLIESLGEEEKGVAFSLLGSSDDDLGIKDRCLAFCQSYSISVPVSYYLTDLTSQKQWWAQNTRSLSGFCEEIFTLFEGNLRVSWRPNKPMRLTTRVNPPFLPKAA